MEKPCCVGVARDSSGLAGKEITAGKSLKVYYTAPKAQNWTNMGIIVVHDIFGFGLPNCKYIVDHFAAQGYEAVLPDFYASQSIEPWPASESEVSKPLEGEEFTSWFGKITSESFWEKFAKDVNDAVALLKKRGCSRFGIMGFCWGGIGAEKMAQMAKGKISAAVSAHGCMHSAATYKDVTAKILYISVNDDAYFGKASQEEIVAAGGKVKIFDGMHHGFVVRGDFADAKVKAAADEAMADAEALFSASCMTKPTFIKTSDLDPSSNNVNIVLKVVSKVTEVEAPGGKFYELTCGDAAGKVVLSLTAAQQEFLVPGQIVRVRNGHVKMVKNYIRVKVDKWGKFEKGVYEELPEVGEKDFSSVEYELVP